jgi:metallo-beta-lactamase family protein
MPPDIFRLHLDDLSDDVQEVMQNDSDSFGFGTLFYVECTEESKKLNSIDKSCVIISASGMM